MSLKIKRRSINYAYQAETFDAVAPSVPRGFVVAQNWHQVQTHTLKPAFLCTKAHISLAGSLSLSHLSVSTVFFVCDIFGRPYACW